MDSSNTSTTNNFTQVKGINNLIFRDVLTYTPDLSGGATGIYDYNTDDNYPMFTRDDYDVDHENQLKPIKLGRNQFPKLSLGVCTFRNEG